MKSVALKVSSLALLLLTLPSFVRAQSMTTIDWETLRPDGEDFSVQMPKGSAAQSGKEPYHKFELNVSTYISQIPNGPTFAVVALSGIKSNPQMYSEMERLNSYVDAFKNLFPAKVRGKGATAKLTLVGDKVVQGNQGREYRLTIQGPPADNAPAASKPALSGTAHVVATRKRFYAVVFLSNKKEEELQDQFLSSFLIPERIAPPAAVAAQPPAQPTQTPNTEVKTPPTDADATAAETPPAVGPGESNDPPRPRKRGPIAGGVLNGKAISLPPPEYPPAARAAGVAGIVVVRITIDEYGNVISAQAVSGPPALHQASVNAALMAKFAPTSLVGEPVQVTGVVTYNFVRQ